MPAAREPRARSPNTMFSAIEICGNSAQFWNSIATPRLWRQADDVAPAQEHPAGVLAVEAGNDPYRGSICCIRRGQRHQAAAPAVVRDMPP
jgi:hypothetical protein